MFSIYDGRAEFYQWDLDRKLIVNDNTIKQVHFCNKTDECSLVCDTYADGSLTVVDVPNILLQSDWRINVYGYTGDYTKHSAVFKVNRRTKPADYIYTETEVFNYQTALDAATAALDAVAVDTLKKANPVSVKSMDGTEISELITWLYESSKNVLADGKWSDLANWEIVEPNWEIESEYEMRYYIDGLATGEFIFNGVMSGSIDIGSANMCCVDDGGNIGEWIIDIPVCDGEITQSGEFYDFYSNGKAVIVIRAYGPQNYLTNMELWSNPHYEFYDGSQLEITVIQDGNETTYNADTISLDWFPGMGYNWLTGRGIDIDGIEIEPDEWGSYCGNAYPELAKLTNATIKSKIGTLAINYKAYPTEAVNNLQAQIDSLKSDIESLKQKIKNMGW